MMKLTPIQRKILAEFSLNSRNSVSSVARKIGAKEHVVRNAFDFLSNRLNMKPYCFSNPFRQGLIPYRVYFCLKSGNSPRIAEMLRYLSNRPETIWIFSLYGYYHFGFSLRTSSLLKLDILLEEFDTQFGDLIEKRTIGVIAQFAYFVPWLAFNGRGLRTSFEYRLEEVSSILDETDRKIVNAFRKAPDVPVSKLAKTVGILPTTMQYRIQKLIETGVLIAFSYTYNYSVVGIQSFLLLVSLHGFSGSAHERIIEFVRQHPRGMWAAKIIGEWNVEIEVALEDPRELHTIIQQIYDVGQGAVREVITHVWGEDVKV
jgi:DNA-binding Lrp family transcriptional regulator